MARGRSIQRALLAGDKETGVTIMKMDAGLDTGDVLMTRKIPLDERSTAVRIFETLAEIGGEALLQVLPPYLSGELSPTPQPKEGVTYAEKIKKEEGRLDWTLPAFLLERSVRALNPWPGAWFTVGQDRIKVLEAVALAAPPLSPPGTVLDDQFTIACGDGALRLVRVQKVGKSPLFAADFLRGYDLPSVLTYETL